MRDMRWYAVNTKSNQERRVSLSLTEKQVEHYLPSFWEIHQWKDRRKAIEQPLFPGYIFVRIENNWESRLRVLRIDGVARILGQGDRIEAIPEVEIDSVRQLQNNARCQAHPLIQEGAWVRVRRGPLENLEGLLVRVKNQTRLVLSITLLSQSVSAEIDASDVQFLRSGNQQARRIA
jgi:transcription antitermination factor NusG